MVSISASGLSIGYKNNPIASDINLSVDTGDVTALLGPNGAGKSTLIKTLTGEIPPISGQVEILGKTLDSYSKKELAKMLAIVTTDPIQAGGLTVRELVGLGRQPHTGFFGRLSETDRKAVESAMSKTGISHKAEEYVAELSDGERQKTMIAKAIAQDTPVIVLDEPFSFLDVAARIEILSLLGSISATGKAILYSSHDVSQALRMASKVMLFTRDRQLVCGAPSQVIANGDLAKLFDSESVVFSPTENDFIARNNG